MSPGTIWSRTPIISRLLTSHVVLQHLFHFYVNVEVIYGVLGFGLTLNVQLRKELGTAIQGASDKFLSRLLQELIYANYN